MSYEELMAMLRAINEKRVPPKMDFPDIFKDIINGKFGSANPS